MISLDVLKNAMSFIYPRVYKLSQFGEELKDKLSCDALDQFPFFGDIEEKKENLDLFDICNSKNICAGYVLEERIKEINMSYDNHLYWSLISRNPNFIHIIKLYPENIVWNELVVNPSDEALDILKQNLDKFHPSLLVHNNNPKNIELIELQFAKIAEDFKYIFTFPEYIDVILKNQHLIYWDLFSLNTSQKAIDILYQNQDKIINWKNLCKNTSAAKILRENLDKVDWDILALNEGEGVIEILEENVDKVDFDVLILNKKAGSLLEKYYDRITNWGALFTLEHAIPALLKRPQDIDWYDICENPKAYQLLKDKLDIPEITNSLDLKHLFECSDDVTDIGEFCLSNFDTDDWEYILGEVSAFVLQNCSEKDRKIFRRKIEFIVDHIHLVPKDKRWMLFDFESQKVVDYISKNIRDIEWHSDAKVKICKNRLAFNLLRENKHLICEYTFTLNHIRRLVQIDMKATDNFYNLLIKRKSETR